MAGIIAVRHRGQASEDSDEFMLLVPLLMRKIERTVEARPTARPLFESIGSAADRNPGAPP